VFQTFRTVVTIGSTRRRQSPPLTRHQADRVRDRERQVGCGSPMFEAQSVATAGGAGELDQVLVVPADQ